MTPEKDDIELAFEEDWKDYPKKGGNKIKAKVSYKNTVGKDLNNRIAYQVKTDQYIQSFQGKYKYMKNKDTWMLNWPYVEIMEVDSQSVEKTTFEKKRDVTRKWLENENNGNESNPLKLIGG